METEKLKIRCTASDCNNGLHCFRTHRAQKVKDAAPGACVDCGELFVDWNRFRQLNADDFAFKRDSLCQEHIRNLMWNRPLTEKEIAHARKNGLVSLHEIAKKRLVKTIGPAIPPYDGRQTPFEGNIIVVAQHAMACCCRRCVEYWHGIPQKTELTPTQLNYFGAIVDQFIDTRLAPFAVLPTPVVKPKKKKKKAATKLGSIVPQD